MPGAMDTVETVIAARPCSLVTADRESYDDGDLVEALRSLEVCVVQPGEFLSTL